MGYHYDAAPIPDELRRDFDVYDRIRELGLDLGTAEDNVTSLAGQGIAGVVFHESGLVYLSGVRGRNRPDERRPRRYRARANEARRTPRTSSSRACTGR